MASLAGHLLRGCLLYPQKKHLPAEVVAEEFDEVRVSDFPELSPSSVLGVTRGVP